MYRKTIIGLMAAMLAIAPAAMAEERHEDQEMQEMEEDHGLKQREIIKFIKENLPEARESLDWVKENEPDEYEESVNGYGWFIIEYRKAKEISPKGAAALLKAERGEFQVGSLIDQLNETEDEDRQKNIKKQIRARLVEIFDAQLEIRALDIAVLENEIKEVRQMLEKRKKARDKIIDRRFKDLLDENDDSLEWW